MRDKIRVLLLEKVESLGKAGDIVTVAEGHARNFLFPQGKAALATEEAVAKKHEETTQADAAAAAALTQLQAKAESLEGTELTLKAKVKEGTELYAKITAKQIADELNKQASLTLKAKDIVLPGPVIDTGSYDVAINLSPEVSATIRVTVQADEGK